MKLSIICVTQAAPEVRPLLAEICSLAHVLGAELTFGCDGAAARAWAEYHDHRFVMVQGSFIEEMLDIVISACTGDYILRLDDDEKCSPGLVNWLHKKEWTRRDSWFFSRCHLWPTPETCLVKQPYFPDFQARLAVKRQTRRPAKLHAAHAYPAYRAPALAFIEHHVYLVKTRRQRQETTAKYETIRTGQPFSPDQVNVVMPYDDPNPEVERVASPRMLEIATDTRWWREPGMRLPENLEKELADFRASLYGGG